MTRNRAYALTAGAAGLYVLLCWIFADKLFTGPVDTHCYSESSLVAWLLLGIIVVAGIYQARQLLAEGIAIKPQTDTTTAGQTEDPAGWKLLMGNVFFSLIWLPIRFFVGHEWLTAGEHKIRDSAWMDGGTALQGYFTRVTTVPEGGRAAPAGNYGWFQDFIEYMLRNEWYTWFAKVIAIGEFMVGLGLLRAGHEHQLPTGRLRKLEAGALRTRRPAGHQLEGSRLVGSGPVPAAGSGNALEAWQALPTRAT